MRRRIRIVANPVSGRGRAGRLAAAVLERLRRLGAEPELVETRKSGDARDFAARSGGIEALGIVGGDGTLNEAVNGLPESGAPPLAVLPSGTANVLAKEIGLGRSPERLARVLAEGREIPWDLGVELNSGRRFLLFLEAGYNASVVHLFHAKRTGPVHMWHYVWWGLKSLAGFRPPAIRVELDGRELPRAASWVLVSNVASYGGPLVFTPRAKPDNGRFDVLVFDDPHPRATPRMMLRALLGWAFGIDLKLGGLSFHEARRIRLASADGRPVPVQVDGDPGGHLPADIEVRPGGVRILAP